MAKLKQVTLPYIKVFSKLPRNTRLQIRTSTRELELMMKIRAKLKHSYVRELSDADIIQLALESLAKEQGVKV